MEVVHDPLLDPDHEGHEALLLHHVFIAGDSGSWPENISLYSISMSAVALRRSCASSLGAGGFMDRHSVHATVRPLGSQAIVGSL